MNRTSDRFNRRSNARVFLGKNEMVQAPPEAVGRFRGISKTLLVVALVAIVFTTTIAGYAMILAGGRSSSSITTAYQTTSSSQSANTTLIQSLAYAHWRAIGEKNVTSIMLQYSTHYRAVWFFIGNNSNLGPENGRYDCNIPTGPNNCNHLPEFAWYTFFNHTSMLTYIVCNYSILVGQDNRVIVNAIVWYQLQSLNLTLKVPYEMDFLYYNNTWAVLKDYFGLQQSYAVVLDGYINPHPSSC